MRALLREYEQFDKVGRSPPCGTRLYLLRLQVTYVLNDRTQDWPYKHVFWHQVGDLSHCQLVVEVQLVCTLCLRRHFLILFFK